MLKHEFATIKEVIDLYKVSNFRQFKNKLKKLSKTLPKINPVRWNIKVDPQDNEKKILGDGFELFSELFIDEFGINPQIGITNYEPVDPELDEGIDGFCENLICERSAVQCKYVSNEMYELSANKSNLPNFLIEATLKNINWQEDTKFRRAFLITTAKGLHYHTKEKWHDRVWVINGSKINTLTNDNIAFWKLCVERLENLHEQMGTSE